ncbi:MAG: beta-lactamase family protein, partial [Saprospiraceae bacterium]|nr:beta-lactamase family protein [Saprospiraceae bacterium]
MKKTILSALLAWFSAANVVAQTPTWPFAAALDSIVTDAKYRPDHPGFAVMVIQNGQIVYDRQRGLAYVEKQLPLRAETMFNIGSITKQFTAAAILLLEEKGLLRLSDPVQQHLPELPDFGTPITLQHLLAHTSGIPDHFEVASMQNNFSDRLCDFDKVVELLRAAPEGSFPPGSDFAYCNTGYMLLAKVVERVSGLSIHDFAMQNIFRPLGMEHSNFFQQEKDGLPDGTTSYGFQPKKGTFKRQKPYPSATGATGVQTTLRDFFQWDQNFYHNRLGNGPLIEKMETSAHLNDGSPTFYGGGLLLKPFQGHQMVSHRGGWSSFLMEYRRFPDLGISILVASNNDFSSPFPIADTICRRILPKMSVPKVTMVPLPFIGPDLEGTFLSASNFIRRVKA